MIKLDSGNIEGLVYLAECKCSDEESHLMVDFFNLPTPRNILDRDEQWVNYAQRTNILELPILLRIGNA